MMEQIDRVYSSKVVTFTLLRSLALLVALASVASAQIGGPKDIKPKETAAGTAAAARPASAYSEQIEREGIVVDFSIKTAPADSGSDRGLVAGADAVVTFSLKDKRTGQPITGLHPNAWISARTADHAPNEAECRDKVRTLMGGLLSVRPDVDLNSYVMLTLNHDNTITFINPQVAFNVTKLENIITLPGAGADWALSKNKEFLYVTMPGQSAVAVINTLTRKLVSTIPTGGKGKPTRIALQPDGRYAWVGLDEAPLVAVIDTATNKLAGTVAAGDGLHNIAHTADSKLAYVTNSAAGTVSAIDATTLKKVADIKVGETPVPVAYSAAANAIYVAAINGGSISVINPANQAVVKTIPLARGVVALRFEPEGRYGFAVNQIDSKVSVIDSATNSVIDTAEVVKSPDQITFTARYAYIRGLGSEKFSLIEVNEIAKKGKISVVSVQAGRQPASAMPGEIGVADMISPTPEGNAVMIANAPDQMIYYYIEGMMAPMGTFQNYKRRARALTIIDRSLAEVAPGVYASQIKLRGSGQFDVPIMVDQPRIVNCFTLDVAASGEERNTRAGASIAVEAMFDGKQYKPGQTVSLRYKIVDSVTKQPVLGLSDIQVLVFEPPGIWQQRQWAKEIGGGVYEINQVFPHTGLFNVMLRSASRGVAFADLPLVRVPVVDNPEAKQTDATVKQ